MFKNLFSKKIIYILSNFFLLFSFFLVFYFSFKTVIHNHAYSQIFISYALGFVKNGLLGEFVFFLKKMTNLDFKIIINLIFLLFHLINIYLFLKIIKPTLNYSKIIFIFLVLNPALIVFPIYDIGAFLRKEIFAVTAFLFHIYISQQYNYDLINKRKYNNYLAYIIFPLLSMNILIHSIQILFLPVHFLIIKNNLNNKFTKKSLISISLILIIVLLSSTIGKTISPDELYNITVDKIGDFNKQFSISSSPYLFLTQGVFERFKNTLPYFKDTSLVKLYFFSIIIIFTPLLYMLEKIKITKNKFNSFQILLSIVPFILLIFLASDWGRWIYLMAVILVGIKLQYKIININDFNFSILIKIAFFLSIGFYLFFFNLSHCCVKNLFFYGLNQNIHLFFEIMISKLDIIEHIKY